MSAASRRFGRSSIPPRALRVMVPAPLRRFVTDGRALSEQVAFGLTGAIASELALVLLYGWGDFAGVIFHTVAALLGAFAMVRLGEIIAGARELVSQGWRQGAAVAADRAETTQEDADLPTLSAPMRDPWIVGGVGLVKTIVAGLALKFLDNYLLLSLFAAAAVVILPAITVMRLWRIRTKGKPTLWSRMLAGRAGKWLFVFAGTGLRARGDAPVPGEPTALALGQSIEALYAALPAAHQKRLAEVPDLAARLQARAFSAGTERTPAVAALETLRLDILRLQAGTIAEPELTADLEAVRMLGEEVDRVVAATVEVHKLVT